MLFQRIMPAARGPIPLQGSTLASLGIHAMLLGGAFWYTGAASRVRSVVSEGIVFLAPPPSPSAGPGSPTERISFAELPAPEGLGDVLGSDVGSLARPVEGSTGERAGDRATEASGLLETRELPNIFAARADSIYLSSQVDNPAAFDARSGAPMYPDSLRLAGVEGAVTAQFVVDTTGRVDVTTFVLLESSHGRFTQSVREALPRMLFRPAELNGHKIKQLVQLPFVFKLQAAGAEQRPAGAQDVVGPDSGITGGTPVAGGL